MAKKQLPGNGKNKKRKRVVASTKGSPAVKPKVKKATLIASSDTIDSLKQEIEAKRLAKLASLGMVKDGKGNSEVKKTQEVAKLLPEVPKTVKQTGVRLTERSIFNQSTVAITAGKKIA